ncbi:FG-GAP-like repeat-containing protein [Streptomyces sp. NPDC085524]|uniref:FG-GAP-like repeat-containing protein n=1 Tax=unclassified Streptomyces TaxID=2593676 RepID=UPI0035DD1C31
MTGALLLTALAGAPAAHAQDFAPPANYPVGLAPQSVATGNFDGVNGLDLVTANPNSDNVSVLLNTGSGTYGAATNTAVGDLPVSVAVADVNGDSKADLIVANALDDDVSVLLGDGSGAFPTRTDFAVGDVPVSVAVGDFDGVNGPDLAVANAGGDSVSVLLNNGSGGFGTQPAGSPFAVGDNPFSVAVGDFNGDAKQDLAVANSTGDSVSVLLNTGSAVFAPAVNYPVGNNPFSVAVGDFDGVSGPDLAVANLDDDTVSVLLNNGSAAFAPAPGSPHAVGDRPFTVAVAQLDNVGGPDLAVTNEGPAMDPADDTVSVLPNTGSGTFGTAEDHATHDAPTGLAVGDFNGDSLLDLATANSGSNDVSVLLQVRAASTTLLVSSPNPSVVGQTVTFTATVSGDQGTPTGTVTFKDGATTLGTDSLDGTGTATFPTNALSVGTHSITAEYGGDTTYEPSTSNTVLQVVSPKTCANATPTIVGTDRADNLVGTSGDDVIFALRGNDTVNGLGGDDLICGGPGNDVLMGGTGNDRIEGADGNDTISGNDNDDTLLGGDGKDTVNGNAGNDSLFGEAGNDTLDGGTGTNTNNGGPGRNICTNPTTGPGCLV